MELAREVVDRQYALRPELASRYGPEGRAKCEADIAFHLAHLEQSVAAEEPVLFREYTRWAREVLVVRGIRHEDVAESFRIMADVVGQRLPGPAGEAARLRLAEAMTALAQMPMGGRSVPSPGSMAILADSYLKSLLSGRRDEAEQLVLDAAAEGASIRDLYIGVLQASQYEVGRLWQCDRLNVAQEHYCTAATQHIMSQLYPKLRGAEPAGRRFVGACVASDQHDMGLRMVTDFFQFDGWDTAYLGANLPIADLVKMVCDRPPDVLGISATLTPHIWIVEQMIAAVRAAGCGSVILVGGRPFALAPELAKKIGADGTCAEAVDAVALATKLLDRQRMK